MHVMQKGMGIALVLLATLSLGACAAWPGADRTARPTAWPLASPVADAPSAGICAGAAGSHVMITIEPDAVSPRCVRVTPGQRLTVENQTGETREASIALFTARVPSARAHTFDTPFGDYLAPGVHLLRISGLAGGSEIWLWPEASPAPTPTAPLSTQVAATEASGGVAAPAGALYGAGPESGPALFAWPPTQEDLGPDLAVFPGAVVSHSGRWLATPATYPDAEAVHVYDLDAGTRVEYAATPRYHVYRLAFDPAETRLAFLELAPGDVQDTPWAIVVLRLEDATVTRFEGTTMLEAGRYPGNPLGWTASGDELLLSLFIPYSEGLYSGVVALSMPPNTPGGFVSGLVPRAILSEGEYMSTLQLAPDGTRLLYLGRNPNYVPADYEPPMQDWAVNQLWLLDLATGQRTLLYEVTDGDALLRDAAWSPDGSSVLFAQGHYAGWNFRTLTLKISDLGGQVRDVAPVPTGGDAWAANLYWCHPETAFAEFIGPAPLPELWAVDLTGEAGWWEPQPDQPAFMVGCVRPEGG
jgi:hypothetical protein